MNVPAEVRSFSSFELDNALYSREKTRSELSRFLEEVNEETDLTKEETARLWNFISFLQWRLNEKRNAFDSAKNAKDAENENLINLNNRILFYQENGKDSNLRVLLLELKELQTQENFKRLKAAAIAELAYCFGRLGDIHQQNAIRLYEKAIDTLKPERHLLWEYGLGLNIRRQANIYLLKDQTTFKEEKDENNKRAAKIFIQIILHSQSEENTLLQARSWCELAWILFGKAKLSDFVPDVPLNLANFRKLDCILEASKLATNNHFVLERCGKEFRQTGKLQRSKECLEKALKIRDTCFTRHHLALALRNIVKYSESVSSFTSTNDTSNCDYFSETTYPNNNLLNIAVSHLQAAIKIKMAIPFYHDLGIIYMMLERFREAFDSFSQITMTAEYKQTVFVSVYERQGICRLKMASAESNTDVRETYEMQGKRLVYRAIEMAAMLLSEKLDSSNSIQSLQLSLDQNGTSSSSTTDVDKEKVLELLGKHKKMIDFYEILGKHKKMIDIYEMFTENESVPMKYLERYMHKQDFYNALLLLSLLRCTKQSGSIDRSMHIEAYIKGAECALNEKDFETSNYRFKQAYRLIQSYGNPKTNFDSKQRSDVQILHTFENDEQYRSVNMLEKVLVTHLGWKITINANDCLKTGEEHDFLRQIIEQVPIILIFLNSSNCDLQSPHGSISDTLELVAKKYQEKALVLTKRGMRYPKFWKSPHIDLPTDNETNDDSTLLENKGLIISDILREMVKAHFRQK